MKKLSLGIACAAIVLTKAQAQPALRRKDIEVDFERYFAVARPIGFSVGDFNGDGRPDLVVTSNGISVLLNMGQGSFGSPIRDPYTPCGPFATGDFNRDGNLDIVAVSAGGCGLNGHILLGKGDGTFLPPQTLPSPVNLPVVAGDFNGDGILDIVSSGGVLLGNGNGSFRPPIPLPRIELPAQLGVEDLNGDGKADLVARFQRYAGATMAVLPGNGDGTFGAAIITSIGSNNGFFDYGAPMVIADFNRDGLPDVAAGTSILLGKGDGRFTVAVPYSSDLRYGTPEPIAAADMNGDGYIDVVMGGSHYDPAEDQIWLYAGTTDGIMALPAGYTVGWGPFQGITADLDGDGKPDLATLNYRSNTISLLLSDGSNAGSPVRAVSAAGGTAIVAPGSVATLKVPTGVPDAAEASSTLWPTRLAGVGLEVHDAAGQSFRARLRYVSPTNIDFQVPAESALGEATLALLTNEGAAAVGTMQIEAAAPGILLAQGYNMIPMAINRQVEATGSQTDQPVFECPAPGACFLLPVPPSSPAVSSYLVLYGTGFRGASRSNVTCYLRGYAVPVQSVGPSGKPGIDEIVIQLPDEMSDIWQGDPRGSIYLSINGIPSNMAWILFSTGSQ
jgi:uncharacterized protein (TIGR03437 family)